MHKIANKNRMVLQVIMCRSSTPAHMSKEIDEISTFMATGIPSSTNDFNNEDTKAEYVGFN
jgi:hypothetical protein